MKSSVLSFFMAIVIIVIILITFSHEWKSLIIKVAPSFFTKVVVEHKLLDGIERVLPIDWDRDGEDELLFIDAGKERDNGFRLFEKNLNTHLGSHWDASLFSVDIGDIDGDGYSDIIYSTIKDTAQNFFFLKNGSPIGSSNKRILEWHVIEKGGQFDRILVLTRFEDLNDDSIPDIICLWNTSQFSKEPRGIIVFDGGTGKELWRYELGPGPQYLRICDLNSDGEKDIVFVGQAYDNHRCANGLCDSICYLFALGRHGKPLWNPIRLGGGTTYAHYELVPCNKGVDTNIVVATQSFEPIRENQRIAVVSGRTGQLLHEVTDTVGFLSIELTRLQPDRWSILLITTAGNIHICDTSLQTIDEITPPLEKAEKVLEAIDFDGDGDLDIPLLTDAGTLWVFDGDFDSLFTSEVATRVSEVRSVHTRDSTTKTFILEGASGVPSWLITSRRELKAFSEVVPPFVQVTVVFVSLGSIAISMINAKRRKDYHDFLNSVFQDNSRMIIGLHSDGLVFRFNDLARENLPPLKTGVTDMNYRGLFKESGLTPIIDTTEHFINSNENYREVETRVEADGKIRDYLLQMKRFERKRRSFTSNIIISIQDVTERNETKKYEALSKFSEETAKILAHDLKNPLSSIKLFLQELQERLFEPPSINLDAVNQKYLKPSLSQVEELAGFLDDFLKKTKSGDLPFEFIDVPSFLHDLVKIRESMLSGQARLQLSVENGKHCIWGQRDDLERAFGELIENACQAVKGAKNGRVRVTASLEDIPALTWRIEVSDNGCGIPTDLVSHIFEPYFTTKGKGHHGLGLWIVQKIILRHEGNITVESTPEVGTKFVVMLPVRIAEQTNA